MDSKFDAALKALTEEQFEQGVRSIILTMQGPTGDVVVSIVKESGPIALYARIDRGTRKLVRLRS